ncbi:MAG TPA: glycerol-3-phosphate dehydrogenase/oxidase [Candidatus Baltobacteraceae bacterium]|nr:glycerol-3-phosphate dehydrogenase/oxidase [Candidatus Baltobacteraceae bacterium]
MNRDRSLERLRAEQFDILIVGGGATGLGTAVDAAARGYKTALIEAADFAKATSSRSTKLIHGGVRYLAQGNIALVREALLERTRLYRNAPELVHELPFIVPAYGLFDLAYYSAGLKAYDVLAGDSPFARSRLISPRTAKAHVPSLEVERMRAAVMYTDAQFDDARLALALARTASDRGAAVANYVRADGFVRQNGRLCGAVAVDAETRERFTISARVVVNASGIFADTVRRLDDPQAAPLLTFSRGSHVVLAASALGEAATALLVPRTSDGRVLFAIPWHDHTLVGTTEVAVEAPELEPRASDEEVHYIISTLNRYLQRPVTEHDVLSSWAGLRPLVNRRAVRTARLSREHVVEVSSAGLVTVTGGKWTTYRKMAEDAVNAAAVQGALPPQRCPTADLRLLSYETPLLMSLAQRVEFAAGEEMARSVEDVLARRTRALFLDAKAARDQAPAVAAALARRLGRDRAWEMEQVRAFGSVASRYGGMS